MTPTCAGHGPATRDQQPPERCQRFMLAVVDPEAGAATVTSWAAPAVLASSLARVAGHAVAAGCGVALGGGVVPRGFGLGVAMAGGGVTLGGGVVAVGVVAVAASTAGVTGGGVAGYAYGRPYQPRPAYRWSVETSVYLEAGRRGAGLGRALYRSLLDVLARQGYRQALAGIALPNPASVGLHQACGFRLTGVQERLGWKLGAWHDVGWFQRELAPGTGPPAAPIAVDRLAPRTLAAALQLGACHVDRPPDPT